MDVLVCVKRVPVTGGRITLTEDELDIDTRYLGFTVSPHEECAVEEAVRLVEADGGSSTVLTLGPAAAEEQLRDAMAMGANRAVLIEADGPRWDGGATAAAIARVIGGHRGEGGDQPASVPFDPREVAGQEGGRRTAGHGSTPTGPGDGPDAAPPGPRQAGRDPWRRGRRRGRAGRGCPSPDRGDALVTFRLVEGSQS